MKKLSELTSEAVFHAYHLSDDMPFQVEQVNPSALLNRNRLDILGKVLYLKLKDHAREHAKKLYLDHIGVMTRNSFTEYDGLKTSKEDFLNQFDALYEDMKEHGYRQDAVPIPVDQNMQIMDGAHRTACAIVLHQPVTIIHLPVIAEFDKYDYKYFVDGMMDSSKLDEMVLEYVREKEQTACVNLWPSAVGHDQEAEELLEKRFGIVYKKEVKLNETGAFNYLAQIYAEYDWAQNSTDGFQGIYRKLVPCFPTFDPVRFYIIDAKDVSKVTETKEEIRMIYNLGKHSVHTTDNHDETVSMASILLSDNSIDFMNHCESTKFPSTLKLLEEGRKQDHAGRVYTGSIVLALYGIREANDLDYLSLEDDPLSHNDLISLYGITRKQAVFDPSLSFTYFNMRFLTLQAVRTFKANRKEGKDLDDLKLIDLVLSNQDKDSLQVKLLRWKRRTNAKIQGAILRFAHKTGTYDLMRKVYRKMKGQKV